MERSRRAREHQRRGQDTRRYGFRIGVSSHTSFIGSGVFQFLDLHLGDEWL